MDDIKDMARAAKKRLKTNYWENCIDDINKNAASAKSRGFNEGRVKSSLKSRLKQQLSGEKEDEFYLKVKEILDREGEVSDAIGRLTDPAVYEKLSYEEKQRYNLEISNKYIAALKRYRLEKDIGF